MKNLILKVIFLIIKMFINHKREFRDKKFKRKLSIYPENKIHLYEIIYRFIIKKTSNKIATINY